MVVFNEAYFRIPIIGVFFIRLRGKTHKKFCSRYFFSTLPSERKQKSAFYNLFFTNKKTEKTMKKFFASLAVALAAMCFAPTAGATEMVSLHQEVAVENVVTEAQTQLQQEVEVWIIIYDDGTVVIIIIEKN